jgi:hypothetical protein
MAKAKKDQFRSKWDNMDSGDEEASGSSDNDTD